VGTGVVGGGGQTGGLSPLSLCVGHVPRMVLVRSAARLQNWNTASAS